MLLAIVFSIFLSGCTLGGNPQPSQSTPQVKKEEGGKLKSSMRELLERGSNLQCKYSFTDVETSYETRGSIYISGKRFAQESEVVTTDKTVGTIKMNMISDGSTVYTWNTEMKNTGMKMVIDTTVTQPEDQKQKIDLDSKTDYDCTPWAVDESKFAVPKDVNFIDTSEMMKGPSR